MSGRKLRDRKLKCQGPSQQQSQQLVQEDSSAKLAKGDPKSANPPDPDPEPTPAAVAPSLDEVAEGSSIKISCDICALLDHSTSECPLIVNAKTLIEEDEELPYTRAFLTLPETLGCSKLSGERYKIWSKKKIPSGTQFGPLVAPTSPSYNPSCQYALKLFEGKSFQAFLDTTDEDSCNWMILVQFTDDRTESNCFCYQFKAAIYFSTIKEIESGESLIVSYSPGYESLVKSIGPSSCSVKKKSTKSQASKNKNDKTATAIPDKDKVQVVSPQKSDKGQPKSKSKSSKIDEEPSTNQNSLPRPMEMVLENPNKGNRIRLAWKCRMCDKIWTSTGDFALHMVDHYLQISTDRISSQKRTTETAPPYYCDICKDSKGFNRCIFIVHHFRRVHGKENLCNICNRYYLLNDLPSHECVYQIQLEDKAMDENSQETVTVKVDDPSSISYPCGRCDEAFSDKHSLIHHEQSQHSVYSCHICQKSLHSLKSLRKHVCRKEKTLLPISAKNSTPDEVTLQIVNPSYKCGLCECSFKTVGDLEQHFQSSTCVSPCSICGKILASLTKDVHLRTCEVVEAFSKSSSKSLICPESNCESTFENLTSFWTHTGLHSHPFSCPLCEMKFQKEELLANHECSSLQCHVCSEICSSLTAVRGHFNKNHGSERFFYCFECMVPFADEDALKHHDAFCTLNNWSFTLISPVDSEQKKKRPTRKSSSSILPLTPFVCELCGACYTKQSSIKSHRLTHGDKRFRCGDCGKKFHRRVDLRIHQMSHRPPQFECPECGMKLKSKNCVKMHMLRHTGVKNFACSFCGKAFNQKGNLITHEQSHIRNEDKNFRCHYCDKFLGTKQYLRIHIRKHENGNELGKPLIPCRQVRPNRERSRSARKRKTQQK